MSMSFYQLRPPRSGAVLAQGAKRPRSTKSMVRIAAVLILAVSTAPVVAQGPGGTASSTVAKLVVTENGGVNVRLSPELTSCVSQSGYGENYASISPNHLGINRMQADLLAAYLSGSTVSLYLDNSSCNVAEMMLGGW